MRKGRENWTSQSSPPETDVSMNASSFSVSIRGIARYSPKPASAFCGGRQIPGQAVPKKWEWT